MNSEEQTRKEFEAWANKDFYADMADISETWDPERQVYTRASHHMAWCAWRHQAKELEPGNKKKNEN